MRLHLGCGQKYLQNYINIDYPLSEHSVQRSSVADEFANLLELRFRPETIDEVRLHHVFEHFTKAVACGLLASWNSWLRPNGIIHIEVPDFEATARAVLDRSSSDKARAVGLRHLFGSQEAAWAIHYEGYTPEGLKKLLEMFGYQVVKVNQERYLDTYNLEVIGHKAKTLSKQECRNAALEYLTEFMVADVESERALLGIWIGDYAGQIGKSFAPPPA
jgi:predicted SAM-dependent methyltransferase